MLNNTKPNPAKYNLRTDEGKMLWNRDIDEYYKQEKLVSGIIIPSDNIYKNVKKLNAYQFLR